MSETDEARQEHLARVTSPLLAAWDEFQHGHASLLDLARRAEQAETALDNASAPLPQLLHAAASDLEYAFYASESEDHPEEAARIMAPVLAAIAGVG
ncbi:MAG: hypothetical protein U0R68_05935 [Candidatus Nanopelagicales bacterium]